MTDAPRGEILPAGGPGAAQVDKGMTVLGVDGQTVGRVKEARASDFVLERPHAADLVVPYSAILATPDLGEKPSQPSEIVLGLPAAHLDDQGWPTSR
jgi:hypothetical protein